MDHLLAAVDLGSNSFRLSIGRVVQQNGVAQIYAIDRMRESVRFAAGLDAAKIVDEPTIARAIQVLERFGERLHGFHPNRVRAVATNTFRIARNVGDILPRAEAALGFPIEVIAGQEEARLIFSGVTNELPPSNEQRLVIDIGGGSTEVIIGKGYEPIHLASLFMGCVNYTQQFFPGGEITEARMVEAEFSARREFEGISKRYRKTGWHAAYGSSGTAKGLLAVLLEGGMSPRGITLEGLEKLRAKLIRDGRVIMEELPGLKSDRALVLAGGLAIMLGAFRELKIKTMMTGDGALRMGVLYDLLGRDSAHDKRHETVRQYMKRYHIDTRQSLRVKRIALSFFRQVSIGDADRADLERTLGWASDLHEVGLSIAHADYHKHSAYVLQHADMPGFSTHDQALLALIVLGHQGKTGKVKARHPSHDVWMTLLCLRLAVLLCRRREDPGPLPITVETQENRIRISAASAWLKTHPLSEYSLHNEAEQWRKAGFSCDIVET